jgi:hypothetical protein
MRRFMGDALRDEPAMLSDLKDMHDIGVEYETTWPVCSDCIQAVNVLRRLDNTPTTTARIAGRGNTPRQEAPIAS